MSGIDDRDAAALTYLAMRIRAETYGAGAWDQNGTASVIAKLKGRSLALTAESIICHAADPKAKTPGVLLGAYTPPKPSDQPKRGGPPKARSADECRKHPGQWATACATCATDDIRADYDDPEPAAPMARDAALAEARAALVAAKHTEEEA